MVTATGVVLMSLLLDLALAISHWEEPFQTKKNIFKVNNTVLTHYVPTLPSYRNQSIDLHNKSVEWFLYKGNTGT